MRFAIGRHLRRSDSRYLVLERIPIFSKRGLLALLVCSALVATTAKGESVGMGGGGAIYSPVISPSLTNSSLMFVSCDMSGLYRSADRGLNWKLLDQRQVKGSKEFSVAFDPANTNHLVAFHPRQGLKESTLGGADGTWNAFAPALTPGSIVTSAAFSDVSGLAVVTAPPAASGTTLGVVYELVSNAWVARPAPIQPPANGTLRVTKVLWARDPSSGLRTTLVAANTFNPNGSLASSGVFIWSNSSWTPIGAPSLSSGEIVDFAAALTTTQYVLYAVLASGRVYRYAWNATPAVWVDQSTLANGLPDAINPCGQFRYVTVSANEEVAYAALVGIDGTLACRRALYKRATNGTWSESLVGFQNGTGTTLSPGWIEPDPPQGLGWGFGGAAHGIAVTPQDPARAVFVNNATVATTADGGATWGQAYSSGSMVAGWQTNGLDVTSAWNYYVNGTTHYIASTDIGLSRSVDGSNGQVWQNSANTAAGQWLNFYALSFETAGVAQAGEQCAGQARTWAAVSRLHDIPDDKTLDDSVQSNVNGNHGTVLLSCNGGVSWNAITNLAGLSDGPVVSLLYRLENNVKTLYASVWRQGVFTSSGTTIGKVWSPVGSFPAANQHVYQLRENAGSIYVTVAATKSGGSYQTGGFYKLVGNTWTNLTAGNNLGPIDFAFDPSGTAYLATIDTPQFINGGLWKVIGSSASPVTTLRAPLEAKMYHDQSQILAFAPTFIGNSLYLTTNQGIWKSDSQTTNWTEAFTEIPFLRSQRLIQQPDNSGKLYVTTFGGGVWKPQNFVLSANPGTISVSSGTSGSSSITVTPSGSFSSSVTLSASNVPLNSTGMSFSPNPVPAGASSTATFNSGTAAVSTYTITVKGTSGSLERTTQVICNITPVACGYSLCSGVCVNEQNDVNHCGSCNACTLSPNAASMTCTAGSCQTQTCNPGYSLCGGVCVNEQNDVNHCGSCNACTLSPNAASMTCTAGSCQAQTCITPGYSLCGGACLNVQNDVNHCGSCNACTLSPNASSMTCASGSCQAQACNGGYALCPGTGTCVDQSCPDPYSLPCGQDIVYDACGNVIPGCQGGLRCPAGQFCDYTGQYNYCHS